MGGATNLLEPLTAGISSILGGSEAAVTATSPEEIAAPEVPTTEERAKGITESIKKTKLRRRTKSGRASTILTSPLGVEEPTDIKLKTLLGQ